MNSILEKIDTAFVRMVDKYFAALTGLKIEGNDGIENVCCGLGDESTLITSEILKARLLNQYKDYFGHSDTLAALTKDEKPPIGRANLAIEDLFDMLINDWRDGTIDQFNLDENGQKDLYFIADELRNKLYKLFDKIESETSSKDVFGEAARPFGKLLH